MRLVSAFLAIFVLTAPAGAAPSGPAAPPCLDVDGKADLTFEGRLGFEPAPAPGGSADAAPPGAFLLQFEEPRCFKDAEGYRDGVSVDRLQILPDVRAGADEGALRRHGGQRARVIGRAIAFGDPSRHRASVVVTLVSIRALPALPPLPPVASAPAASLPAAPPPPPRTAPPEVVRPEPARPEPVRPEPFRPQAGAPVATVRAFYRALANGDGDVAAQVVIPAKRYAGPLSAPELTRFYSGLRVPLRILDIAAIDDMRVQVRYAYGLAGGRACDGAAVVDLVRSGAGTLISRINSLTGC